MTSSIGRPKNHTWSNHTKGYASKPRQRFCSQMCHFCCKEACKNSIQRYGCKQVINEGKVANLGQHILSPNKVLNAYKSFST